MISGFRRRLMCNGRKPNTYIIYSGEGKLIPSTTDATEWGANYIDSKSIWDPATGVGIIQFDAPVQNIPAYAFSQSYSSTNRISAIIKLPKTVKTIGSHAFSFTEDSSSRKSLLTSINLNEGLLKLDNRAFLSNRNLKKVVIPDTVEEIDKCIFNSCYSIEEVTIGENVRKFTNSDINGSTTLNIGTNLFGIGEIQGVYSKIKYVRWNAINCGDFTNAFYSPFTARGMYSNETTRESPVKYITFGNKVKNIPGSLFWKCHNITGIIEIPRSVERIGDRAFQECTGVTSFYIKAEIPPRIEPSDGSSFTSNDGKNSVFRYWNGTEWTVMNTTIYVPANSISLYEQDPNWKIYADAGIIEPWYN
jgi:hypothetical protein